MGLLATEISNRKHVAQNSLTYPDNSTLPIIEPIEKERFYILIPFAAFLSIVLLSLLVYLMARKRRRLVHIYFKKRNGRRFVYEHNEYDSLDETAEDEERRDDTADKERGDDAADNSRKTLLRGKLHINNRYENYLSTSQLKRSSELFT